MRIAAQFEDAVGTQQQGKGTGKGEEQGKTKEGWYRTRLDSGLT